MATAVTQNVTQASKVRDLGDDVSECKALFGSENNGAQGRIRTTDTRIFSSPQN